MACGTVLAQPRGSWALKITPNSGERLTCRAMLLLQLHQASRVEEVLTNTFLSQELNVDSLLQPLQLGGAARRASGSIFTNKTSQTTPHVLHLAGGRQFENISAKQFCGQLQTLVCNLFVRFRMAPGCGGSDREGAAVTPAPP